MSNQKNEKKLDLLEIKELSNSVSVESKDNFSQLGIDQVGPGKEISLHFSLSLNSDGSLIDSNFGKNVATFVFGDGNFLPGFERSLIGLKLGEKHMCILSPEQAFGLRNEDNLQNYPRYRFPADLPVEKGLMINFTDSGGNNQAGVINDFDAEKVIVDFNHPLAGKEIEFKVEIKNINAITKLENKNIEISKSD